MTWALAPRGLRARIVLAFGAGALLVSAVLSVTTFLLARGYLLDQREQSATHQAFLDGDLLRSRLATAGTDVADVLSDLVPSSGSDIVVRQGGAWYSSSLEVGARDVPVSLRNVVADGSAGTVRVSSRSGPRLVIGVAVPTAGLEFYELAPLAELQGVLHTLAGVLGAGAAAATAAGAAFGVWASRRVMQPLEQVATVATDIAGGRLTTRLPSTRDPELIAIVGSFNAMVDALATRIDRDNRFVGDVSHELRSPLTSLITSVEVLGARRAELSPRSQQALALVENQLSRFRATLDDLLELARLDAATADEEPAVVSLGALVHEVLMATDRSARLLTTEGGTPTCVRVDKHRLERAVRNLLDNADRHADGVCAVSVVHRDESVLLMVDDAGPGVPLADRERIFERFARGPNAARGSLPGAGLGLALVAETAAQAGGAAWCTTSPRGGTRMIVSLPAVSP